jgi:glycosyltransferase involved in cell wall biosynthesis
VRPPVRDSGRARELAELIRERDVVLRERLLPVVYRFLAPSRFLRERFLEWGIPPEQIDYCRTGIDLAAFRGFERVPGDGLRVTFIGTPVPHKGVHVLMQAWKSLPPETRATGELRVYGNLDHNPGYIRRLQGLADSGGGTLCGGLRRDQVPGALARTDLLVVPSVWYENSPLIILEALATRTPILVSDLGGMAELVEPGRNGFRFAVGDSADLARHLARFLDDPSLLDALYPDDLHVKSVDEDARQFEELYREAIEAVRASTGRTAPS